ncbi:hypothetical protein EDC56_3616 [Sinobacterium caligoides]|uniref:Lipoprotein n=1 Tax=Sinobacterium caligoides TaxID=933926 RepID=A0A3N2DDZ3_9GAMM|nr:hypothetical protein [Sinobacterium caligoides]ROR97947.1 hypothetical protein EDC56_3616 [Sinobacterium caligoides]
MKKLLLLAALSLFITGCASNDSQQLISSNQNIEPWAHACLGDDLCGRR